MLSKIIFAGLASLLLAGCNATTGPIAPPDARLPAVKFQNAQPVNLKNVRWKVYSADNIDELIEDMKKPGAVAFVLTPEGYSALSHNVAELRRYIREQQKIIVALQKTIEQRR